jgi:bacteriocin-like protein
MIMQDNDTNSTSDNELPPIEGELTDEDLKHVSGGWGGPTVNATECILFLPNEKFVDLPDTAAACLKSHNRFP